MGKLEELEAALQAASSMRANARRQEAIKRGQKAVYDAYVAIVGGLVQARFTAILYSQCRAEAR